MSTSHAGARWGALPIGGWVFAMAMLASPSHVNAQGWQLLSREEGCVSARLLARAERLPRAPQSPEDFARMLRERGDEVSMGPAPGMPAEQAVEVRLPGGRAPIFVRDEFCRKMAADR